MIRPILAVAAFAAAMAASAPSVGQGAPPRLGLPIACTPGKDCFVQNYFDHDAGPGVKDHRCGTMTYDGHDGVDIRLPTTAAQRRGVAVLAAASGTVKGVRDGEVDRVVASRAEVQGRECGNGVIVSHANGWETQYCHMARGSIAVKPGQAVAAGARLGNVGLSGWTQFPHAHMTVRQGTTKVDPFTGGAAACDAAARPLWSPAVAAQLTYASPQIINAGFTTGAVEQAAIEGESLARPTRGAPLVAYVRAIGLNGGDRLTLTLSDPNGRELAKNAPPPLDRAKAQQFLFAGARPPSGAWAAGRYRLTYTVVRAGKPVLSRTAEVTL
jgi:murein DD-endopeptidase MepM/ murein hydrolase activator NlpD